MNSKSEDVDLPITINSYVAEKFGICIQENKNIYKIFQIIFQRDGSIFINFPYYSKNAGILACVTYPSNMKQPTDLSFLPNAKTTSHLVKYSHHSDGKVHFSQDGKILTLIEKFSPPLNKINGHFFTIYFQGIRDFKKHTSITRRKDKSSKRQNLFLKLEKSEPDAIKIVGRLHPVQYVQSFMSRPNEKPIIYYENPKHFYKPALMLQPPRDGFDNYILTITYDEIPKICNNSYSCLIFTGGFDEKTILNDNSLDTSFLSFRYPIDDIEEMTKIIGSADFRRELQDDNNITL